MPEGYEKRFNEIVANSLIKFLETKFNSNTVEALESHLQENGSSLKTIANSPRLLKKVLFVIFKAGAESTEAEIIRALFSEFGFETELTDLEEALALLSGVVKGAENEGADSLSETRVNNINRELGHTIIVQNKSKLRVYTCKDCGAIFLFKDDVDYNSHEIKHKK